MKDILDYNIIKEFHKEIRNLIPNASSRITIESWDHNFKDSEFDPKLEKWRVAVIFNRSGLVDCQHYKGESLEEVLGFIKDHKEEVEKGLSQAEIELAARLLDSDICPVCQRGLRARVDDCDACAATGYVEKKKEVVSLITEDHVYTTDGENLEIYEKDKGEIVKDYEMEYIDEYVNSPEERIKEAKLVTNIDELIYLNGVDIPDLGNLQNKEKE